MSAPRAQPRLVGASVRRLEDPRLLTGQGTYVDDVSLRGMLHAAFVRSPHAHADIAAIDTAAAADLDGVHGVFTGADVMRRCRPMVSASEMPGWQSSPFPAMPAARVFFAGETVAAVVADDRYLAEDAAELVRVDYAPRPVVATIDDALAGELPPLHDGWSHNWFLERRVAVGDVEGAFARADGVVAVELRSQRSSGIPLECRGCVARYDRGQRELTLWTSTQVPHLIRTGVADHLGLPENRVRVIAPELGGGFGVKCVLYPEELSVCVMAMDLGRPVKWIEDRQEHLLSALQAREHRHHVEAAYTRNGEVLALRADIKVNAGAYSVWPWTCVMEAGMAMGILPGPYRIRHYEARAVAVATNTCFTGPYRGVARPAANLSIERVMDEVARHTGLDPLEVRRRNYVQPGEFPYTSVTGLRYDSGSFVESLDKVAAEARYAELRRRQAEARTAGRLLGIGFSAYTEQTAHGPVEWAKRAVGIVPGFDAATVRMDPSGDVIAYLSTHSHGQAHETTFAQIVADELCLPLERIRIQFGDTATAPYGHGTFASRSAVMGGGAALRSARVVADRLRAIAAHHLEVDASDVELRDGQAQVAGSPSTRVAIDDLARWAYHRPDRLPAGMQSVLEATSSYDAEPGMGTFANAAHLVLVELDPELGSIDVLGYWVTEDCGTMINPLVVDGQVHGGVAQGIGGALLEEFVYERDGQPVATTLKDYRLVGATDIPHIDVSHLVTPSPDTLLGTKGMGEGGAISPGAALAAAVEDALRPIGRVFVDELPLTPERVRRFVARAREDAAAEAGA